MDIQPQDLDNYITGHYGEDQYRDDCPAREEGSMSAADTLVRDYGLSENDAKEALEAIGYSQLLEALREARRDILDPNRGISATGPAISKIDAAIKKAGG